MELLVVSQTTCKPCVLVKNYLNEQEVEYKVFNITNEESVEIQGVEYTASELSIMSTPITILFDEDGEEISRVAGANESSLDVLISQL